MESVSLAIPYTQIPMHSHVYRNSEERHSVPYRVLCLGFVCYFPIKNNSYKWLYTIYNNALLL